MSVRKPSGITLKGLNISKGAGKLVRRKVDVRTVCIAWEVDADASEKMHQTRRLYGQACNLLVPIVVSDTDRKKRLWQRYNLHKAAYPMVRTKMSVLGAQLACNVMRSVSSMYQSWISNHPNFSKDKKMVLPSISFRNPVVHLDKNTIRFFNNYTEASVDTPVFWLKSLPERRRRIGFTGLANATSFGSAASKARLPDGSCTLP